jgi:hypothetical protein
MSWWVKITASAFGCYALGSCLLAMMMVLHYVGHRRKLGRAEWLTVFTCLPVVNAVLIAYLVLEGVTKITGKPINIGAKR